MRTGRLEAFSDGVLAYVAVAITWLVPDRRAERFVHDHALED